MGRTVALRTSGGEIAAYRADPAVAVHGALVLIQEIFGVNAHIRAVADGFAAQGYAVLAPALFDPIERGVELDYGEAGTRRGRELREQLGFERAVEAVAATADALRGATHTGVAAVGFCWGGSIAFLANTRLGLPAVSYYGGRSVPFLDERLRAPMLFHFGERDSIIPPEHVALHRQKQPDAEIHLYPAGHGFNCDQRADYDAASAMLAMRRTLTFLERVLP